MPKNDLTSTLGRTLQETLVREERMRTAVHILIKEIDRIVERYGDRPFEATDGKKTGLFYTIEEYIPYYKKGFKIILDSREYPLPYASWAHDVVYPVLDALTK